MYNILLDSRFKKLKKKMIIENKNINYHDKSSNLLLRMTGKMGSGI